MKSATGYYDDFYNYFKNKKIYVSDDLKKCADVIAETDQEMQRIAKELKVL